MDKHEKKYQKMDTNVVKAFDPEPSALRPRVFFYQNLGMKGLNNWLVVLASKEGNYKKMANLGSKEDAYLYTAGWQTGYLLAIEGEDALGTEDKEEEV
jgi:hypothetical protein